MNNHDVSYIVTYSNYIFTMTAPVNFYREVDLVKESVIPKQDGVVLSSEAKEATVESTKDSKPIFNKTMRVIGDNEIIDGISVRYPVYLASFFHGMRSKFARAVDRISLKVDEKSSKYYKHETKITTTIANLHSDPREELLPGFTYVAVASMAGSIFTRNKSILLRLSAPLVLGSLCFSYVLPVTFRNTAGLLHDLEAKSFPDLIIKQDAALSKTREIGCKTAKTIDSGMKSISCKVSEAQHLVKQWTGLNVE